MLNNLPIIITEIYNFLDIICPDLNMRPKILIILLKLSQIINFKRIKFSELENERIFNLYGIILAQSGIGKDRSINSMDSYILKPILENMQLQLTEEFDNYASKIKASVNDKKLIARLRKPTLEINNATPEGLFEDALTLEKLSIGSIFSKISEFCSIINSKAGEQFINGILNGFDSVINSKSIKTEKKVDNIKSVPLSLLALSDPTLIYSKLNRRFDDLLKTGFCRRALLSFQIKAEKTIIDTKTYRQTLQNNYNSADNISNTLLEIYKKLEINSVYKITENSYDNVLLPYQNKINEKFNESTSELLKLEISSRELKVLNISCLCACLNHPEIKEIQEQDLEQAIGIVEELAKDFESFINYKPDITDTYQLILNFFINNQEKIYTKTNLSHQYRKYFKISRNKFLKNYKEILNTVKEMADIEGYILINEIINHNGESWKLVKK